MGHYRGPVVTLSSKGTLCDEGRSFLAPADQVTEPTTCSNNTAALMTAALPLLLWIFYFVLPLAAIVLAATGHRRATDFFFFRFFFSIHFQEISSVVRLRRLTVPPLCHIVYGCQKLSICHSFYVTAILLNAFHWATFSASLSLSLPTSTHIGVYGVRDRTSKARRL